MEFSTLASFFQSLEETSSRNTMIEILAKMFKAANPQEAEEIAYLSQGRVVPFFVPLEFGMADKMVIRAISQAYGVVPQEVMKKFGEVGDLGVVALRFASLAQGKRQKESCLSVSEVFEELKKIVQTSGQGAVGQKINLLAGLLGKVSPLSARYIVRIPLGKLRLGFSDMTVLDSFSWMLTGDKSIPPRRWASRWASKDLKFVQ